jgi:hypothetical protein
VLTPYIRCLQPARATDDPDWVVHQLPPDIKRQVAAALASGTSFTATSDHAARAAADGQRWRRRYCCCLVASATPSTASTDVQVRTNVTQVGKAETRLKADLKASYSDICPRGRSAIPPGSRPANSCREPHEASMAMRASL